MLALAKLRHSGAVAVVRQLRRPSLKRRQTKPTVAPIKTKNPVRADTTHILARSASRTAFTASSRVHRERLLGRREKYSRNAQASFDHRP
jgi:hypothetical protein